MADYFKVDKEGLRKVLARQGKSFVVTELISNCFDEDATHIEVTLEKATSSTPGARGLDKRRSDGEGGVSQLYRVVVEDDDPFGFTDLSHAYTLFAESEKKVNPTQRGRFNLGEKLVIAACERAVIASTTGTVTFSGDRRRVDTGDEARRERGSVFTGFIYLTDAERDEVEKAVKSLLPPYDRPDLVTTFNGTPLASRQDTLVTEFEAPLITEYADHDGNLRRTRRKGLVRVYDPLEGEVATLYEMGIPVVDTGDRYHVDVLQKIPLTTDRDNVQPAYLRRLRALVLEHTHNLIAQEPDSAGAAWVSQALEEPDVSAESVESVLKARYGDKRVISDLSDPEGTKIAVSEGYAVIQPGSFNKKQWSNIKRTGAALPAGQVTPSPKPYKDQGTNDTRIPEEKWTPGIRRVARLSRRVSREIIGREVPVEIVNDISWPFAATYGPASPLTYNLGRLGHAFFNGTGGDALDRVLRLLIHEISHHKVSDHLSRDFSDENCLLGAKLARLAAREPDIFDEFLGFTHDREDFVPEHEMGAPALASAMTMPNTSGSKSGQ